MAASSVCVLRAHRLDGGTLELLDRLRRDLGRERVFVVFDDTRGAWTSRDPSVDLTEGADVLVVTDDACERENPMHRKGYGHDAASWSFWHPETAMVLAHEWLARERGVTADLVWFVEYDVRCQGSFADVFAECDAIAGDVMACGRSAGDQSRLRLSSEDPGWCWWANGLEGEIAGRVGREALVGCFFPVVRLSRAGAAALRAEFGRSTGFCEVYVSTLIATTPGLVAAPIPVRSLGHFLYSPSITPKDWSEHDAAAAELTAAGTPFPARLFHPVKFLY